MKVLFIDLDATLTYILEREAEAMYDTASHLGLKITGRRPSLRDIDFQF